jgi:hypothetical protein
MLHLQQQKQREVQSSFSSSCNRPIMAVKIEISKAALHKKGANLRPIEDFFHV